MGCLTCTWAKNRTWLDVTAAHTKQAAQIFASLISSTLLPWDVNMQSARIEMDDKLTYKRNKCHKKFTVKTGWTVKNADGSKEPKLNFSLFLFHNAWVLLAFIVVIVTIPFLLLFQCRFRSLYCVFKQIMLWVLQMTATSNFLRNFFLYIKMRNLFFS